MHGNLAVDDRNDRNHRVHTKESRRTVTRKHSIPAGEKLLYLFTIIMCVVVAGTIIFRYAQIYEVNSKIQHIEKEIAKLEMENKELMLSVRKLQEPKRLNEIGVELGYEPIMDKEITEVASPSVPSKMKVAVID